MRNLITVIALSVAISASAQNSWSRGYEAGYCAAQNENNIVKLPCSIIPPIGPPGGTYNDGFLAGSRAYKSSSGSNINPGYSGPNKTLIDGAAEVGKSSNQPIQVVNSNWNQKNYADAMARIQKARTARISNWVDKPFIGQDLSQYKYLVLLPPRKHHKDAKRNLFKKMKGLPIEYVNISKPYATHDKLPEELKKNPDQVLYLTVDLRAPYLVETYIQIYDSYGELIYSMGKEAWSAVPAFKILREELEFAFAF